MVSPVPVKLMKIKPVRVSVYQIWPNDGSYYSGSPYVWSVDLVVQPQTHSSPTTRIPYEFNAQDIVVGDWISNALGGMAWRIKQIITTLPQMITCLVEDVDQYNTFSDPTAAGDGGPPLNIEGFVFSVDQENRPLLQGTQANVLTSNWQSDIQSRFFNTSQIIDFEDLFADVDDRIDEVNNRITSTATSINSDITTKITAVNTTINTKTDEVRSGIQPSINAALLNLPNPPQASDSNLAAASTAMVQDAITRVYARPANMASLRGLSVANANSRADDATVYLRGYRTLGDGGEGYFYWNATSLATEDSGIVVRPTSLTSSQPGRWIRIIPANSTVSPHWFGAYGNATQDDSGAIQSALDTGIDVSFNNKKIYRIDSGLRIHNHKQCVDFQGASIRPYGNFDALTIEPILNSSYDHVRIMNMHFDGGWIPCNSSANNFSAESQGTDANARLIVVNTTGRVYIHRIIAYNCWNGIEVINSNNVTLQEINIRINGYFAYKISGIGDPMAQPSVPHRTDIVRAFASGCAFTSRAAQIRKAIGLYLYGAANSVELTNFHIVGPGQGVVARKNDWNQVPFGLTCHGFAASDYSAYENILIEAGEDFYFGAAFYGHSAGWIDGVSWNEVNGVHIMAGVKNVQFTGGKITDSRCHNVYSECETLTISGMKIVKFTSNFGRFSNVKLGPAANRTRITGNEMGARVGNANEVDYCVSIDAAAKRTIIGDNVMEGWLVSPVLDKTSGNQVSYMGNTGVYHHETQNVRMTNFAGAHATVEAVLTGGVLTGLTVINKGNGYWTLPNISVSGSGTGAQVSVALDGTGGLTFNIINGGTNYGWARIRITPVVVNPEIRPGGTETNPSDFIVRARGGAAALLANDRGIGFAAFADANAKNYPRGVGRASGQSAIIEAFSTINEATDLLVRGWNGGHLAIDGTVTEAAPAAATSSIVVRINGVLKRIPLSPM